MKCNWAVPRGSLASRPTWLNALKVFDHVGFFICERNEQAMMPQSAGPRWAMLQSNSHLPDVQATIRREITRGTIRVIPASGGCIRIIPMSGSRPVDDHEHRKMTKGTSDDKGDIAIHDRRLGNIEKHLTIVRDSTPLSTKKNHVQTSTRTTYPASENSNVPFRPSALQTGPTTLRLCLAHAVA